MFRALLSPFATIPILVSAFGVASPIRGSAQSPKASALATAIDSIVQSALKEGPVAGISVEVIKGGTVITARGYGSADLENGVPATPQTVYRIGSITKQFTAAAILQLVEQGKIRLDDEITRFLPDYPVQSHHVLIRHLLNHTSGIKSYTGLGPKWQTVMRLDLSHDSLVGLFKNETFDFAPGEQWKYDNSGYYLLGMIVEMASGQTYPDYLREHVFKAAGLESTYYCDAAPIIKHRAQGYEVHGHQFANAAFLSMTQPYAAGSLCSTVGDLVKWQQALEGGEVVGRESYRLMTTPDTLNNGTRLEYGFGLGVGDLGGHRVIEHGGGINGFLTHLARYPADSLTVVVLSNTEAGNPEAVAKQIARRVLGVPAPAFKQVGLTSTEIAAYAGEYLRGELKLLMVRNGNTLQLISPDGDTTALVYLGGGRFVGSKDKELEALLAPPQGRADTLTLKQSGHTVFTGTRAP